MVGADEETTMPDHPWPDEPEKVTPGKKCTDPGVALYRCPVCTQTKTEPVPGLADHPWKYHYTKAGGPSCLDGVIDLYRCPVCSAEKEDPKPGNKEHLGKPAGVKAATCVAAGDDWTCTVCLQDVQGEPINNKAHYIFDMVGYQSPFTAVQIVGFGGVATDLPADCIDAARSVVECYYCKKEFTFTSTNPADKVKPHTWDALGPYGPPLIVNGVTYDNQWNFCTVCGVVGLMVVGGYTPLS